IGHVSTTSLWVIAIPGYRLHFALSRVHGLVVFRFGSLGLQSLSHGQELLHFLHVHGLVAGRPLDQGKHRLDFGATHCNWLLRWRRVADWQLAYVYWLGLVIPVGFVVSESNLARAASKVL